MKDEYKKFLNDKKELFYGEQKKFALIHIDKLIAIYNLINKRKNEFFGVFARNEFEDVFLEYRKKFLVAKNDIINAETIE